MQITYSIITVSNSGADFARRWMQPTIPAVRHSQLNRRRSLFWVSGVGHDDNTSIWARERKGITETVKNHCPFPVTVDGSVEVIYVCIWCIENPLKQRGAPDRCGGFIVVKIKSPRHSGNKTTRYVRILINIVSGLSALTSGSHKYYFLLF